MHQLQRVQRALFKLCFAFGLTEDALDREMNILETGQPRQQRMILKHHAAIRSRPRNFAPRTEQDS
jgi:hypothetical protein